MGNKKHPRVKRREWVDASEAFHDREGCIFRGCFTDFPYLLILS